MDRIRIPPSFRRIAAAAGAIVALGGMGTSGALAQSKAGFELVTPSSAVAAPQVVRQGSTGGEAFRVVGGEGAGRAPAPQQPSVAVAARPTPPEAPPVAPKPVAATLKPAPQVEAAPAPAATPPGQEQSRTPPAEASRPEPAVEAAPKEPASSVRATEDANVKQVDVSHPLMKAALQRAQDGLDDFLKLASHPPPGTRGLSLKVAMREGGQTENIWVAALERRTRKKMFITVSETFSGRLANAPAIVRGRKIGDRITFSRSDIRDWTYVTPDGRMVGNATACAIAAAESSAAAEQLSRRHGLDCGWTTSVATASR